MTPSFDRGKRCRALTPLSGAAAAGHDLRVTISPRREVSIRPPVLIRVYVGVFLVVWIGTVVWTTMIRHHGSSAAVGVVFVAFGATLGWRLLRLGVQSQADGSLTIRNNVGGRRLDRGQVEEFRVGSNGGARIGQRGIQVLLRDGTTYGLDVCRTPFGFGTRRLSNQVDQLDAWLRNTG